jgi:radical SAM protein with 4Fe4S-binding SPASM domain
VSGYRFENIGWTVGNHCNATCGHCYSWKVRKDSREFLTRADVDRVVGQLERLGIKTVNLGGNEPIFTHGADLRRTILPYIIRRLHGAGLPVGLTTNGTTFAYLDAHHPGELRMVNDIDFSLDSPFAGQHDRNRGARLHDLVIRSVQRSLELGIDCSIITCGMRQNFTPDHLSAFLALTNLLGCEFRINTLKPVEPTLVEEMPTAEQYFDGFAFLMNHSHCITLGESCLGALAEAGTAGCPCGTSSFRINAKTRDGRIPINPCVYAHEYGTGDLLTDDILDIVASPSFKAFGDRRREIPRACRETGCEFLERCRGGCTARTYLTLGKLDARDPYCPQEHVDRHGRPPVPQKPDVGCHDGIRVHDNYLCTWIGKVDPGFRDARYTSLAQFTAPDRERGSALPMSGHAQVDPSRNGGPSLIQIGRASRPVHAAMTSGGDDPGGGESEPNEDVPGHGRGRAATTPRTPGVRPAVEV